MNSQPNNTGQKAQNTEQNVLSDNKIIQECSRVNISEFDILEQCGGRSLILIDGQALLESLINESYIDFQHGGQFLHLTDRIELYIRNLTNRRMKYHVVFFGEEISRVRTTKLVDSQDEFEFEVTYKPMPSAQRTARRLLISHLQLLGCRISFFTTWLNNPEWDEFILSTNPVLMIGHRSTHFLMYHLHIFKQVLYVTNTRFESNTIMGYCTAPEGSGVHILHTEGGRDEIRREEEVLFNAAVQRYVSAAVSQRRPTKQFTQVTPYADIVEKCKNHTVFAAENSKLAVVLYVCTVLISNSADATRRFELVQLSQLLVATELLQSYLSLEDRAQYLEIIGEKDPLTQFLIEFHDALNQLLWSDEFFQAREIPIPELVDITDGRLFHAVVSAYAKLNKKHELILRNVSLPKELQKPFELAQEILKSVIVGGTTESKLLSTISTTREEPTETKEYRVRPIENKLIQKIMNNWKLPQLSSNEDKQLDKDPRTGRDQTSLSTFTGDGTYFLSSAPTDFEFMGKGKKMQQDKMLSKLRSSGQSMVEKGRVIVKVIEGGAQSLDSIKSSGTTTSNKSQKGGKGKTKGKAAPSNAKAASKFKRENFDKWEKQYLQREEKPDSSALDIFDNLVTLEGLGVNAFPEVLQGIESSFAEIETAEPKDKALKISNTTKKIANALLGIKDLMLKIRIFVYQKWSTIASKGKVDKREEYLAQLRKIGNEDVKDLDADSKIISQILVQEGKLEDLMIKALHTKFLTVLEDASKGELEAWRAFEAGNIILDCLNRIEKEGQTKPFGRRGHSFANKQQIVDQLREIGFIDFANEYTIRTLLNKKESSFEELINAISKFETETESDLARERALDYRKQVAKRFPQKTDVEKQAEKKGVTGYDVYRLQLKYTSFGLENAPFLNLFYNQDEKNIRIITKERDTRPDDEKKSELALLELGFMPEGWQQDMMNAMLQEKSILVTAPTSSGKTFICQVIMERVLRESCDGVVVYVSPNKALVNQMYAECSARYKKQYVNKESNHLLGIFTGDNQSHKKTCQILVTVPDCLEMLLTGSTRQSMNWRKRLRYVIFDEIHMISAQGAETASWANCIRMIDCPFVGLSATVGNATEFGEWLANYDVKKFSWVKHHERPRPLEFSVYVPPEDNQNASLVTVHPCAALNNHILDPVEINNMAAMSPRQCLELYDVSEKVLNGHHLLHDLNPATIYEDNNNTRLADREEFHSYRQKLKTRLVELAKNKEYESELKNIFGMLRGELDVGYKAIHDKYDERGFNSRNMVDTEFIKLVETLHKGGKLPSLMFCLDKYFIDKLMNYLIDYLEPLSKDENNPLFWPTIEQKNRALRTYIRPVCEDLGCQICKQLDPRPEMCDHEPDYTDAEASPTVLKALSLGIAVHYNDMSAAYKIEVERLFRETDSNGIVIPIIISTTTLALGVHMPARSVVMLGTSIYLDNSTFLQCAGRSGRRGFDDVGHVVMIGFTRPQINRFLTADITQVSGPVGISASFVLRLMMVHYFGTQNDEKSEDSLTKSCMRVLQQPLFRHGGRVLNSAEQMRHQVRFSIELLRRLQYLGDKGQPLKYAGFISSLHYSEPANFIAAELVKRGTLESRLAGDWQRVKEVITKQEELELKQTQLSAQKKSLLQQNDRDMMRKVSNELQSVIDEIDALEDKAAFKDDTLMSILEVFCHIFGRRRVFLKGRKVKSLRPVRDTCPELINIMEELNENISVIFKEYVNSYSGSHYEHIRETKLPLTDKYHPRKEGEAVAQVEEVKEEKASVVEEAKEEEEDLEDWEMDHDLEEAPAVVEAPVEKTPSTPVVAAPQSSDSALVEELRKHSIKFTSVSPFAALSGNTDEFADVDQLLDTLNDNIILDRSIVPCADIDDDKCVLNSYMLDFFQHGNLELLIKENGFNTKNAALNAVKGFTGQLKRVQMSISKLEKNAHKSLAEALGQINQRIYSHLSERRESVNWRRKREYIRRIKTEHGAMFSEGEEREFDDGEEERQTKRQQRSAE